MKITQIHMLSYITPDVEIAILALVNLRLGDTENGFWHHFHNLKEALAHKPKNPNINGVEIADCCKKTLSPGKR